MLTENEKEAKKRVIEEVADWIVNKINNTNSLKYESTLTEMVKAFAELTKENDE